LRRENRQGEDQEGANGMQTDAVSYWQHTTDVLPLATDLPSGVEVAIVGGGLLGAATCYWLARQGMQVALLERNFLAAGATGRNGGMVRVDMAGLYGEGIARLGLENARAILTFTRESQDLLRQVVQAEQIPCDLRETAMIRLALTPEQVQTLTQEVALLAAEGIAASFLARRDLHAWIQTPLGPEILGGRWLPHQLLLHPARLVQGLMQAAVRAGAQAYQAQVSALSRQGDEVLLHTSRGLLRAGTVVVAVNAWSSRLVPDCAGLIVPVREQMLAYAPTRTLFMAGMTADLMAGEYWQQTLDGTIVIGGCGTVAPGEDIGVWDSQPTQVVQAAIEQILPRLFPALAPLPIVQRWAGLLGWTSDQLPIVG
jgi:gamma-glutamylputrescine oxidase